MRYFAGRLHSASYSIQASSLSNCAAGACAGVFLLSGMTVLAAGEFSVMDRLEESMRLFTENKSELTEEQKTVFAQYGPCRDKVL